MVQDCQLFINNRDDRGIWDGTLILMVGKYVAQENHKVQTQNLQALKVNIANIRSMIAAR